MQDKLLEGLVSYVINAQLYIAQSPSLVCSFISETAQRMLMKAVFCQFSYQEVYVHKYLPDLDALQVHYRLLIINTPLV